MKNRKIHMFLNMLLEYYSNDIHCVLLKISNEAFNCILNLKERQLIFKIKVFGD